MTKPTLIVACAAAFIGMGVAMPQCPGDRAMQQQVESMQQSQQALTTKVTTVDTQNRTLQNEVNQSQQLMRQLASAVMAQKDAIDRMNAALKDVQEKVAALEKRSSSRPSHSRAKPKSRRKHR